MVDILIIPAVLIIFAIIIRQLLPAPKLSHQGDPLVCVSQSKVLSSERIYFGQSGLFVYRRRILQAHYPFDALVSLGKTMLSINKQKYAKSFLQPMAATPATLLFHTHADSRSSTSICSKPTRRP